MANQDPEATEWSGHEMASEVSERIRDVIAAAESAASAIRYEAEQEAQARRRVADEETRRLVEDARRDAEALLAERMRRISALSDSIIERGEALLGRISHAEEVKRELEELVTALGESASRLARDAGAEVGEAPDAGAADESERAAPDASPDAAATGPQTDPAPAPDSPARSVAERGEEPTAHDDPPLGEGTERSVAAEGVVDAASVTDDDSVGVETPGDRRSNVTDLPGTPPIEDAVVVDGPADGDDQLLGARLVALQMAVAGGNRGEVEAHLRQAFEVPDPQSILDDVFGPGTDASKRVVWPSAADG